MLSDNMRLLNFYYTSGCCFLINRLDVITLFGIKIIILGFEFN